MNESTIRSRLGGRQSLAAAARKDSRPPQAGARGYKGVEMSVHEYGYGYGGARLVVRRARVEGFRGERLAARPAGLATPPAWQAPSAR